MIDHNGKLYLLHNIFCSEDYIGEDLHHEVRNYQQKWCEEVAGLIKVYTRLEQEIEELKQEVEESKQEREELKQEVEELKQKVEESKQEREELKQEVEELKNSMFLNEFIVKYTSDVLEHKWQVILKLHYC